MNRFLDKILIIIAMLSLGYVNLSAQSYDKSYKAVYLDQQWYESFENIIETGSYEKIIGDSLSQHIIWGYPSKEKFPKLGTKLVKELNLAPSDTVTVVAFHDMPNYYANTAGHYKAYIKANNKIYTATYNAIKVKKIHAEELTMESLSEAFQESYATLYTGYFSNMVMLNVFLNWNWDDITCLLKSSGASDNTGFAARYIVKNGIIESAVSISGIHETGSWEMDECYGVDVPEIYMQDIRYESPDSSLYRYVSRYKRNIIFPHVNMPSPTNLNHK